MTNVRVVDRHRRDAALFFVVMDIQVRAEEEHLIAVHGEAFRRYAARTHRYLPGIY